MTNNIKTFIEQNIELLEKNPVDFFVWSYKENTLDRADVAYMSSMLSDAGIEDVNKYQEQALLEVVDYCLSEWATDSGGVTSMPLYDFIEVFLDNCVGFHENYVFLFIQEHIDRWDNYVEIYKEYDMTVIARR